MWMKTVVAALAVAAGSGCAGERALRERSTDSVPIPSEAARAAYYRAAVEVMSGEGYELLHPSEPAGFGVSRAPLRADTGGQACPDVRLDASYEAPADSASLTFAPCLVDEHAPNFSEAGLAICAPPDAWPASTASCVDAALARLKRAWRTRANALLTPASVAPCAVPAPLPTAATEIRRATGPRS